MAKGGGSGEMGNAMTISAVSELPTMFLFGYLLKKKSSVFWFRLSGLFFVLKSIGTFLAFNIPTYYAAQPFQMFGWALINVACVYYVNGIMEPQDSIKGQAYMAMTITAGNVMSSLFGGWLIDAAGVGAMRISCGLHRLADCVLGFERSKNCIGKIKESARNRTWFRALCRTALIYFCFLYTSHHSICNGKLLFPGQPG